MKKVRVLVPHDKLDNKARSALASGKVKKLADYPDAVLLELDDHEAEALRIRGVPARVQLDDRLIRLRSVSLETSGAAPAIPVALHVTPAQIARRSRDYWLVQFVGPLLEEWGRQVRETGAVTGRYIPENALLVSMTKSQRAAIEALPFVVWVGYYEPVYKLSRTILGIHKPLSSDALATIAVQTGAVPSRTAGNIAVRAHTESDRAAVAQRVRELGGVIVSQSGRVVLANLPPERIENLACAAGVAFIETAPQNVLGNDIAAGIIGVQAARDNHDLTGAGQIVGISDTGLDTGNNDNTMHQDFRGRIVAIHDWSGNGADDTNGHGTHVAGSILGNGSASGGTIRGMAPEARLVFQALMDNTGGLNGIPADLNTLFQQAYDDGARIHSNSWGERDTHHGEYRGSSEDIDEFIWNNRDMCIVFLAHNAGRDGNADGIIDTDSMCPQACAKNAVSVGASENNRTVGGSQGSWGPSARYPVNPIAADTPSDDPDGMVAFSSRGPTDDGRIKPDVVAPGTNILSVRSSLATGDGWGRLPAGDPNRADYYYQGGTSMATPITAGSLALIRQYLTEVHLIASPRAALLKGILIHGAVEMPGQFPGAQNDVGNVPDNNQGWGRVNVNGSLFPELPVHWGFRDAAGDAVGTGDTRDRMVTVADTTVPLRVTLCWTDAPSTVAAGGGLVNRLLLELIEPDGVTLHPGAPDNNNVQQVVINTPAIGQWTLRVRGINVATQATDGILQDFALVWSGGLSVVDLYIRDNTADHGQPPSHGTMYHSPDIKVRLDSDPASPVSPNPEHGQTNYIFVTVHNRGLQSANGAQVKLYWAMAGVNLSRPHWKTDDVTVGGVATNTVIVNVPGRTAAGSGLVDAVFEWNPPVPDSNLTEPGHFCLFATVDHVDDPLIQEDVGRVRWEDNLAWRNLSVIDSLPNAETGMEFFVAGEAGRSSTADLVINRSSLPAGGKVQLKMPARWLNDATATDLTKVWQSSGGLLCRMEVGPAAVGSLRGIHLQSNENTRVRLEVELPDTVQDGELYPVYVEQFTDGVLTGRVTLLARAVGSPSHIGNVRSLELHLANCRWVDVMSSRNKRPYNDPDLAIRRGFNGCRFCMPEKDTG